MPTLRDLTHDATEQVRKVFVSGLPGQVLAGSCNKVIPGNFQGSPGFRADCPHAFVTNFNSMFGTSTAPYPPQVQEFRGYGKPGISYFGNGNNTPEIINQGFDQGGSGIFESKGSEDYGYTGQHPQFVDPTSMQSGLVPSAQFAAQTSVPKAPIVIPALLGLGLLGALAWFLLRDKDS